MMLKKTTLYALALIGLMACNDGGSVNSDTTEAGYLTFSVATADDIENITRANKISISDAAGSSYTAPSNNDFSISINDEDGKYSWTGTVAEWEPTTALKEGNYTVTAEFNNGSVGFNNPVFEGKANFVITGGETTPVEIPAKLMNAIVRMTFTDMFKNYYSFEKITVTSAGNTVDFTANESRGAFIEATTFKIEGTLSSQAQGTTTIRTFSKEYQARPTQCYSISFDASNIGGNSFDITFGDEPTETIDLGDIDINE